MFELFTYLADSPYRWATVVPDAMPFLWAGSLIGHSFVATPAKFKAEGIEKALALEVGRATFSLFNRVEILFLALVATTMIFSQTNLYSWFVFTIITVSFLIQRLALRPKLFHDIAAYHKGQQPASKTPHKLYTLLEVIKLIALISLGTLLIAY
jgi:hypothetical protein